MFISSKVKLDITLRLLAGGNVLDLATIFDVYLDHCTKIMYEIFPNLIIGSENGMINMTEYLSNDTAMARISSRFSSTSNGALKGGISMLYV